MGRWGIFLRGRGLTWLRRSAIPTAVVAMLAGSAATASAGQRAVDWDTYGFNASRGGLNPHETAINPGTARGLHQSWSYELGSVIDTQPLLASGVSVPAVPYRVRVRADLVITGAENGELAAVDAASGKRIWRRNLGHVDFRGCDNLPHYGITGTPVILRATNSIYAAGGTGYVYRLDLSTGRTVQRWRITRDPTHNHVWSALTTLDGRVYAELAGNCDVPPYRGQLVSIDPNSRSVRRWFPAGRAQGGGIWSWGGISADPQAHALYAATGNSLAPPSPNDHVGYAERVVRLTPSLGVRASNFPGLPPTGDADFGATPLLYQAPGCPPQLAVGNKFGHFYVYDRDRIGSGPVQQVLLGGSGFADIALLGVAAYLPEQRLLYVANPAPQRRGGYGPGMLAFRVERNCRLALRWRRAEPAGRTTDPTVAGGIVFYGVNDRVIGLDARSGRRVWISHPGTIRGPVFNAPSVVNGVLYVGSWDGRLHAFAP